MLPVQPADVVRGQYNGYRSEKGVAPESETETFIALKCWIDNWRWAGVPFYLRTGKRLAESQRIISIAFREPPKSMFPADSGIGAQGPDHLTFDLADAARTSLSFYGKRPGPGMKLDKHSLQFAMNDTGQIGDVLEAYERLILDAMRGDHTLFTTAEGIERLWECLGSAAGVPSGGTHVRARLVGAECDPPAHRPACLAAAFRARLARPQPGGQLARARRCEQYSRSSACGSGGEMSRTWLVMVLFAVRQSARRKTDPRTKASRCPWGREPTRMSARKKRIRPRWKSRCTSARRCAMCSRRSPTRDSPSSGIPSRYCRP
jgi:hypothetical protein